MRCATPLRLELDQRDVFMAEALVAHPFRVDLLHGIYTILLLNKHKRNTDIYRFSQIPQQRCNTSDLSGAAQLEVKQVCKIGKESRKNRRIPQALK